MYRINPTVLYYFVKHMGRKLCQITAKQICHFHDGGQDSRGLILMFRVPLAYFKNGNSNLPNIPHSLSIPIICKSSRKCIQESVTDARRQLQKNTYGRACWTFHVLDLRFVFYVLRIGTTPRNILFCFSRGKFSCFSHGERTTWEN